MADEEEGLSSYLSFADRYQADLELIYQKYDKTFEDGTVESEEILLSALENYDDGKDWLDNLLDGHEDIDDDHVGNDDDLDEGWESDSSGPTDAPSHDEPNDPTPHTYKGKPQTKPITTEAQHEKNKSPTYPLSSTVNDETDSVFDHEVDPNLSPVTHLNTDTILNNVTCKEKLIDRSNMANDVTLTTTKLGNMDNKVPNVSDKTLKAVESDGRKKDGQYDLKTTENMSATDCALTPICQNPLDKQDTPIVPSSLAEAILSTRNRIANVLFEAVLNSQGETSSKSSGYESLSSDCTSSTIQRTSTLFLADKLLKEFNSRLTAEIMTGGNDSFSTRNKALPIVKPKKSRVFLAPGSAHHGKVKRKTVSLLATRRTIKVNPSIQLATNDNRTKIGLHGSKGNLSPVITDSRTLEACSPTFRGSLKCLPARTGCVTRKALNNPEIIPRNNNKVVSAKESRNVPVIGNIRQIVPRHCNLVSSDSRVPTKIVSTKAVLRLSPGLLPTGKLEVSVNDSYVTRTKSLESRWLPEKPSLPSLSIKIPKLSDLKNHRKSIPLPLPHLPGQKSEQNQRGITWSPNTNAILSQESNRCLTRKDTIKCATNRSSDVNRIICEDTNNKTLPREEYYEKLSKTETKRLSRKRRSEDVGTMATSPKRTCHRPGSSNYQEIYHMAASRRSFEERVDSRDTSPGLKRNYQNAEGLPPKRRRESSCDCSRSLEEIPGRSSEASSKKPRRSSIKLLQDTRNHRIQLSSTTTDSDNNSCICKGVHTGSDYSSTADDDQNSSSSTFPEKTFKEHPSESYQCSYDETIGDCDELQRNDAREVSKSSRRTSIGEFERLYHATKQKRSSAIYQHDHLQRQPHSSDIHRSSEAYHETAEENRKERLQSACRQLKTSANSPRNNRHISTEQCDKSPEKTHRGYRHKSPGQRMTLPETSGRDHIQRSPKQCSESTARQSDRSDYPQPNSPGPVDLRRSERPDLPPRYCKSPIKTRRSDSPEVDGSSVGLRRSERPVSAPLYCKSPIKTRRSDSPGVDRTSPVGLRPELPLTYYTSPVKPRRSHKSDSSDEDRTSLVGLRPDLPLPYYTSPVKANPNHHRQHRNLSTKPCRLESIDSPDTYRMAEVQDHTSRSPGNRRHGHTPKVQTQRRRGPHSSEKCKKHTPNTQRSHTPNSREKEIYNSSPVESLQIQRRRGPHSPEKCKKHTHNTQRSHTPNSREQEIYKSSLVQSRQPTNQEPSTSSPEGSAYNHKPESLVYVNTHRNSPADHVANRQKTKQHAQKESERCYEHETARQQSPVGQSLSLRRNKHRHSHEFQGSDDNFKSHGTGRDNFLTLKSRNPHKILESTRKDSLGPVTHSSKHRVTQSKYVASDKDRRLEERHSSKKNFVACCHAKALPCVPGYCNKTICFDCGTF